MSRRGIGSSRRARALLQRTFPFWERLGLHVTPNHYSQPIPDCRALPEHLWESSSELPGIALDESAQLSLLEEFARDYRTEYEAFPEEPAVGPSYFLRNTMFIGVDAAVLHCMIRRARPRRIIEIGSGMSTLVAAAAVVRNAAEEAPCELVVVDPEPDPKVGAGIPGVGELLERPVQGLPLSFFEGLGDDDILFIDSSHVAKIGSDVLYEILEIVPRLSARVLVHFHDIFLPKEYPRSWIKKNRWFWNEQYLLQAFLCFNTAFEVVWAGAYMNLRQRSALERAFPFARDDHRTPGSFWIRRVS